MGVGECSVSYTELGLVKPSARAKIASWLSRPGIGPTSQSKSHGGFRRRINLVTSACCGFDRTGR